MSKFSEEDIERVLRTAGMSGVQTIQELKDTQPLAKIIVEAMESQDVPCDAFNSIEFEISTLTKAQEAIEQIELERA